MYINCICVCCSVAHRERVCSLQESALRKSVCLCFQRLRTGPPFCMAMCGCRHLCPTQPHLLFTPSPPLPHLRTTAPPPGPLCVPLPPGRVQGVGRRRRVSGGAAGRTRAQTPTPSPGIGGIASPTPPPHHAFPHCQPSISYHPLHALPPSFTNHECNPPPTHTHAARCSWV